MAESSGRSPTGGATPEARAAVNTALQNLMAARLGRGFVPLAVLFAAGSLGVLRATPGGWATALGAAATSASMLAYGLRIVQRAAGRQHRLWMTGATLGSVVPPVYAIYLLGWRGLRGLAMLTDPVSASAAVAYFVLGGWVMRVWMRVVEIERLAEVMALDGERRI